MPSRRGDAPVSQPAVFDGVPAQVQGSPLTPSSPRAVIDGLEADVVTLALAVDIDAIAKCGKLLPAAQQ